MQPILINRSNPTLLQDNVGQNIAQMTVAKLKRFGVLPQFKKKTLKGKQFNSVNAVKWPSRNSLTRPPVFYTTGLNNIPFKRQVCIEYMGSYFDE